MHEDAIGGRRVTVELLIFSLAAGRDFLRFNHLPRGPADQGTASRPNGGAFPTTRQSADQGAECGGSRG